MADPTPIPRDADRHDADRHEIEALFDATGPALYRFARAVVGNGADAEDAVQEAFVRLLGHLRRAGDRTNLEGWLFTVAANACRDRLRRRRRWLPWGPEHEGRAEPDEGLADERRRLLGAAAGRLTARDRTLLALRAQGSSYREIAGITGIREQSIGRLLARAVSRWRRACREVMGSDHEHVPDGHRAAGIGRP